MNSRSLLAALTSLCGVSIKQISEATGVRLPRLREVEQGWPLRVVDQEPFNSYAKWLLRDVHAAASKQMLAPPKLRRHPDLRRRVQDLAEAYQAAFGIAISDDCEVSK